MRCEHILALMMYMKKRELYIGEEESEVYCSVCDEFSSEFLDMDSLEMFEPDVDDVYKEEDDEDF